MNKEIALWAKGRAETFRLEVARYRETAAAGDPTVPLADDRRAFADALELCAGIMDIVAAGEEIRSRTAITELIATRRERDEARLEIVKGLRAADEILGGPGYAPGGLVGAIKAIGARLDAAEETEVDHAVDCSNAIAKWLDALAGGVGWLGAGTTIEDAKPATVIGTIARAIRAGEWR